MTDAPPPDDPTPDDKDWTWVLERQCPECGYDATTVDVAATGDLLRANVLAWVGALSGDETVLRSRPSSTIWSALEYGCHVRDVYRLFGTRLQLMLDDDGATFANWDQDETAIAERYDLADLDRLLVDLQEAGAALADAFDRVEGDQWTHRGLRSDGSEFTVHSFALYLLHDPIHHLWDVEQGFASLAAD